MRENLAVQVTTGNVRTTLDATQKNALGAVFYDAATGCKYRYVKFVATASPAAQACPAVVWWTDSKKTSVTPTKSEAYAASPSFAAGLWMPNTTDISGLTIAAMKNQYGFICVAGIVTAVTSAAAAAGDKLMGAQADWTTTSGISKVADGAAATDKVIAYAKAASPEAVDVCVESL